MKFYNCVWKPIGDKKSLSEIIEITTGIGSYWDSDKSPREATVAERMSWAANRETTRREDMAYCLLGLFGVSMPLLYGEGSRAFQRLQEEILRSTDDVSIHHWGWQGPAGYTQFDFDVEDPEDMPIESTQVHSLMMAPHPSFFRGHKGLHRTDLLVQTLLHFKSPSFSMGQRGLTAHLPLMKDPNYEGLAYGILNKHDDKEALAVPLISVGCGSRFRGKLLHYGQLETVHNEYWRPVWCKPIPLPLSFIEGASYSEILIGRPPKDSSYLWNLPFRLDLHCYGLTLMVIYPPNPVKRMFVLLRSSLEIVKRVKRVQNEGNSQDFMDTHVGRRFLHINVVTAGGTLPLIFVIDYCLEPTNKRTSWSSPYDLQCGCTLDCRVFIHPHAHF